MTYRLINRVILLGGIAICVAVLFFHLAGIGSCPLLKLAGKECVVCGCTRDFVSLMRGNFAFVNPLSSWIFPVLAAEFVFRAVVSFVAVGRKTAVCDIVFHAIAVGWLEVLNVCRICG